MIKYYVVSSKKIKMKFENIKKRYINKGISIILGDKKKFLESIDEIDYVTGNNMS